MLYETMLKLFHYSHLIGFCPISLQMHCTLLKPSRPGIPLQGSHGKVNLLHGCDGLDRANGTILALDISVSYSCLSNVHTFSRHIPNVVMNTYYIGHAVSIQNSNGAILGCGEFETLFPVDANYRGTNTFRQYIPYFPATHMGVSKVNILQYNVLEGIAGTCSSKAVIFDPWGPIPMQVGPKKPRIQIPVGDLSNHPLGPSSHLFEVPLIGSATILGHAVSTNHYICFMHSIQITIYSACIVYIICNVSCLLCSYNYVL